MANNLKDHLKEVADAIRAKKGTSDLINPQDFATEIEGISGGGSGESGGSNVEYLDVREAGLMLRVNLIVLAESAKYKSGDMKIVGLNSEAIRQFGGIPDPEIGDYLAVSIDFSRKMKIFNGDLAFDGTVMEMLTILGLNQAEIDAIPRITKEQFYDLNA